MPLPSPARTATELRRTAYDPESLARVHIENHTREPMKEYWRRVLAFLQILC